MITAFEEAGLGMSSIMLGTTMKKITTASTRSMRRRIITSTSIPTVSRRQDQIAKPRKLVTRET